MPPTLPNILRREFYPQRPAIEFSSQWHNPSDAFSVLLILGGDVVARALAQLAGSTVTPVAFSFGWVAYAVSAVVSAVGENKLMPLPDCDCKVINGRTGYVRDNTSWIIGRIVRDYESWMDGGKPNGPIQKRVDEIIEQRWETAKKKAEEIQLGSGQYVQRNIQGGLCVAVYEADQPMPGYSGRDWLYVSGFATSVLQLGVAAIPCGLFGDWAILLITACGMILSFTIGGLAQWRREKWHCRHNSDKTVVLTKGNGSQHAIVIVGGGKGLDLEDLATSSNSSHTASVTTRVVLVIITTLWILLLISAAGLHQDTWFLMAVGAIGMLHNIVVAGARRSPAAFGVPLQFKEVICEAKVMATLFAVESKYPHLGRSMLETFFPGRLRDEEMDKWREFEKVTTQGIEVKGNI